MAALPTVAIVVYERWREPERAPVSEPAGLMSTLAPERVREVDVVSAQRIWRFERGPDGGWQTAKGSLRPPDGFAARVDEGLRALHATAPRRVLAPDEVEAADPTQFGLDPPPLSLSIRGENTEPFTVHFGGRSPQGDIRYVRVGGRPDVALLPRSVSEPWEAAIGTQ